MHGKQGECLRVWTYIRECFLDCQCHIRKEESHWDQQYRIRKLLSSVIMLIKICISLITNKIVVNSRHRIDVQNTFSSPCFANHYRAIVGTKRSNFLEMPLWVIFCPTHYSSRFYAPRLHNTCWHLIWASIPYEKMFSSACVKLGTERKIRI